MRKIIETNTCDVTEMMPISARVHPIVPFLGSKLFSSNLKKIKSESNHYQQKLVRIFYSNP